MWYIVYREPFTSYNIPQEGYFVSYRDKLSDKFSDNWIEAKKYKTLAPAITKLGLNLNKGQMSYEKFLDENVLSKGYLRDKAISNLLNDEFGNVDNMFIRGRIDKIGDDGQYLGSAMEEVITHIKGKIEKNKSFRDSMNKKVSSSLRGLGLGKSNIVPYDGDESDFFIGY